MADKSDEAPAQSNKLAMDVSKPGKTAPSATSRPVIVGHGPMLKDPMVKEDNPTIDNDVSEPEEPEQQTPNHEKNIAPAADSKLKAENNNDDSSVDEGSTETDDDNSSAVVDAVADQAAVSKKPQPDKDAETQKKQELIEGLVTSKTYFLPIGQAKRRRMKHTIIILIIFIALCIGAAAFAFSSGFIDANYLPLYSQ